MRTYLRRAAVALVTSSALAGGMMALSASPASAAVAVKKDCVYAGETYSHGAIIPVGEDLKQICDNGEWKVWEPKEPRDG
jgi:hypothetical protein